MKTTAKLALALLVALAGVVTVVALADDEERRRTITVERIGQGNCPDVLRMGDGGPEILRLGTYGFLGVESTALTPELRRHFGVPEDSGILVGRVEKDSPAEAAGLLVGDIITRLDGEDVTSAGRLRRLLRDHDAEDQVTLEYWRGGRVETTTATLGERQRCGFDISHMIDLENLPHLELENLPHLDFGKILDLGSLEGLKDLEELKNLKHLENLPRFEHFGTLMELHELDGEAFRDAQERLHEVFSSQDWEGHLERIRDIDVRSIEERLHEAMERLHELEDEIHVEKKKIHSDHGESEIY